MITLTKPTGETEELTPGVLLDGHFGWHNIARLIWTAQSLGMDIPEQDSLLLSKWDDGDADDYTDMIYDMHQQATDWLDARMENGVVHFDGDVYLVETKVCTECGETTVAESTECAGPCDLGTDLMV